MSKRETIVIEDYNGNRFAFFTEANIKESQEIKQVAAELLGGIENYSKLIAVCDNAFLNHQKYCRQKFGVEGYLQKEKELIELSKEKDEAKKAEWDVLYQDVYGNQFYLQFLTLSKDQTSVERTASLIVLCCEKPKDFNFREQTPAYMQGLRKEVETRIKFFRDQAKESAKVEPA